MIGHLLLRTIKWRFHHKITIFLTIVQPLIWLILYSAVAGNSQEYTGFILPGIMVLVLFSSCSSSGMMNYVMKTQGSFYRLLRAPVDPSRLIFSQNLEAILLSFAEILVLVMVSFILGVRFSSSLQGLLLIGALLFLSAFVTANIAYTISLELPNELLYETVMNLIVLPLFFSSTALFPLENMQGAIRYLVLLNPFTHVINSIRTLLFNQPMEGLSLFSIFGVLLLLSFFSFLLSCYMLKKESSQ